MIRDALMTFMEDEPFVGNSASGAIDLYGTGIVDPNARGKGTTLAVHAIVKRGGAGVGDFSGTLSLSLYIDDVDGASTLIQTNVVDAADVGHDGVVSTIFIPEQPEGRYVGLELNDSLMAGGGSANVVDAFVFAL